MNGRSSCCLLVVLCTIAVLASASPAEAQVLVLRPGNEARFVEAPDLWIEPSTGSQFHFQPVLLFEVPTANHRFVLMRFGADQRHIVELGFYRPHPRAR